jgi:hypothetical protein
MLVNKDLTRESLRIYVSNHQIYAKIFHKSHHGKWETEEYFKDYGFEIDREHTKLTIKEIKRLWGLQNPKLSIINY